MRETSFERERRLYLAAAGTWHVGDIAFMGGSTHIVFNSEHLLCNSATVDTAVSENDPALRWRKTPRVKVTCEICLNIIRVCANYTGKTR